MYGHDEASIVLCSDPGAPFQPSGHIGLSPKLASLLGIFDDDNVIVTRVVVVQVFFLVRFW